MTTFKPPWDFFPLHETIIPPFKVAFEVGFDQGELMTFGVAHYDENGHMSSFGWGSENWRETLIGYLHEIEGAKYWAFVEPETGEPRYVTFDREMKQWHWEYQAGKGQVWVKDESKSEGE